MRASALGFPVVGYDTDRVRIERLQLGHSYIEDVDDETVADAITRGYAPTCDPHDLRDFDVAIITVGTPLHEGAPDLRFIESAGRDVAASLRDGALVVLESTTYPGTTEELLLP